MATVWVTGDIHADPRKLNTSIFYEQKEFDDGQDNNFVIITGDFGLVWDEKESKEEKNWLDWLEKKPFTTLFVPGNHENYDRLMSDEFETVEWHGGKVKKIREHVLCLMRGEIFDILGKKFFAFGGAASHDIRDGILEPDDKATIKAWNKDYNKLFRVNHVSWWKEEMASEEEKQYGLDNLAKHNNEVDYIITHCMPQEVCYWLGCMDPDDMTMYFNRIAHETKFTHWYGGHYHVNTRVMMKFTILYEQIIRIM